MKGTFAMNNRIKELVKTFSDLEIKLISQNITGIETNISESKIVPNYELEKINKSVHFDVLSSLALLYVKHTCPNFTSEIIPNITGSYNPVDININVDEIQLIPYLCEQLHINYLNSEIVLRNKSAKRKKSKKNLIQNGAVYTQDSIAYFIVKNTLGKFEKSDFDNIKILDFAIGTGRFYRQILTVLEEVYDMSKDDAILHHVFGVDIDPMAVTISRLIAFSELKDKSISHLLTICNNIICKNALIREQLFIDTEAISKEDCNGLFFSGFDAIVSNPPYLVLKPNKNKMTKESVDKINYMAKYFRNSNFYKYAIEGMLNLYQLSIESMIGMLKDKGELGVICPSTLFADISAAKLRKHLLSKHKVSFIKYFSEDDPLFDNVTQATCIFNLTKNDNTNKISIEQDGKEYDISISSVKKLFPENWEIPSIDKIEWDILSKLESISKMKECPYIRNKRGELDLTLYKEYITLSPTDLRLVRGNMLTVNGIVDKNHEYVSRDFLSKKSPDYLKYDYGHQRLICQQISNQTQKVRLKFVLCQKNDILGNSCNYITVPDAMLSKVYALLNSALLNWRFKITSTNNHINNYELDELPIIDIEELSASIMESDPISRDKAICGLYGLDINETNYIISNYYDII